MSMVNMHEWWKFMIGGGVNDWRLKVVGVKWIFFKIQKIKKCSTKIDEPEKNKIN